MKNELENLIDELNEKIGEDNSAETFALLKLQGKQSQTFREELIELQKALGNKTELTHKHLETLITLFKTFKVEIPKEFDVTVKNPLEFPDSFEISNLKDLPDLNIKEPEWLEDFTNKLSEKLQFPIKSFQKLLTDVRLTGPTDPTKAIAVRLSDGKQFYTALNQIIQTASGDSQQILAKLDEVITAIENIDINIGDLTIDLDVTQKLLGEVTIQKFDEQSVPTATETTLGTFTVPAGKGFNVKGEFGESKVDTIFRLYKNSVKVWQNRNAWTERGFSHTVEIQCVAGDVIQFKVIHNNGVNQTISGGFYGYQTG